MLEISPDTEPQKTITPEQLKTWLADADGNAGNILAALKAGQVQVVTTDGLNTMISKARQFATDYADAEMRCSSLTTDRAVLANTLYYFLKSFEGVAANADKILELSRIFGVGESNSMSLVNLAKTAIMHGGKIAELGKPIMDGFQADWLMRIQFDRLAPMLEEYQFDLSGYQALAEAFAAFVKQPGQQTLPETIEA